ncbi:MAG: short-chain dehydrogenase [Magnetovibrio sp.]|nr:short-chain dehydrogenase [Magnetovibrio sp.]
MTDEKIKFNFNDRKVLITGGTSGIGEAAATAFARAGANVVINGRNEQRADTIIEKTSSLSGNVAFVKGDITDSRQCENIVAHAATSMGSIDIVVNSAGIIHHRTVSETTDEEWQETFNVNVHGMFYICRAAIPFLAEKPDGGVIINIASDAGLSGSRHLTAYCASKGAVLQMSRAMALDYGKDNIRIIPICPGDVDTPMLRGEFRERGLDAETGLKESAQNTPLNRVCSPEQVATMILYASSDSAEFLTGYPLVLDGGGRA